MSNCCVMMLLKPYFMVNYAIRHQRLRIDFVSQCADSTHDSNVKNTEFNKQHITV